MQIELLPATQTKKAALANLLQLYLYDFSEVDGTDVDDLGCFRYPQLDSYWSDDNRHPFLIRLNSQLVGFALVNRHSQLLDPFDGHAVADFFVMRKYRRIGVGRKAAMLLFDRFPGRWEVASQATNVLAHAFWRSSIDLYSHGRYQETWLDTPLWRGPIQSFTSPGEGDTVPI